MRINKVLWYWLLVPVVLTVIYTWAVASNRVYVNLIECMPENVRGWYSSLVLSGKGPISMESDKAALLLVFVKNRHLFPKRSYGDLYNVAIKFQGDPLGIMALQISFDSGNRGLICSLWREEAFRESFMGKFAVYRETNSVEDVRTIEEIILSCKEN
jgi:hypothetical protein